MRRCPECGSRLRTTFNIAREELEALGARHKNHGGQRGPVITIQTADFLAKNKEEVIRILSGIDDVYDKDKWE